MEKENVIKGLLITLAFAVLFTIDFKIGKNYAAKEKQANTKADTIK